MKTKREVVKFYNENKNEQSAREWVHFSHHNFDDANIDVKNSILFYTFEGGEF